MIHISFQDLHTVFHGAPAADHKISAAGNIRNRQTVRVGLPARFFVIIYRVNPLIQNTDITVLQILPGVLLSAGSGARLWFCLQFSVVADSPSSENVC